MTFVLRMALRETRASWRRLLFFFVCIAVGVAAIVALRSVIQSVRAVFGQEAKSLIAADVLISTNRDWTPAALATIDRRLSTYGATARTETIETATMVRPADERPVARMVELRAVQAPFPLYGELTLDGGRAYSHALVEQHGVLVRPELLSALGVAVGDRIVIGLVPFTIRGVIANEPGRRVGGFSLGPRVIVDFADLPSTGLLSQGSRARRVLLARVPDDRIAPLVEALHGDFKDDFVSARSYRSNDDEIGARLRSRRKLFEPRRPDHRDSRRHFRVERDARVRAPEDAQHRRPEVPRGQERADYFRLHAAGPCPGPRGKRPGGWPGQGGGCGHPLRDRQRSRHLAPFRGALRRHVERGRAGHGCGRARVAAVFGRSAPARPAREAIDAPARRIVDARHRLDTRRRGRRRFRGTRRRHGLAGRVPSGGARRVRRIPDSGGRSARGRAGARRRRGAPGAHTVLCAPARRSARVAPGQPDARDPARRRTRRIFHRRGAIAASEPACAVLDRVGARCAGHVSDGYPAGPVERRPRISRGSRERRRRVPDDSSAARAGHGCQRTRRLDGIVRGRAGERLAGARIRGDVPRPPRIERDSRRRRVLGRRVAGSGSVG